MRGEDEIIPILNHWLDAKIAEFPGINFYVCKINELIHSIFNCRSCNPTFN